MRYPKQEPNLLEDRDAPSARSNYTRSGRLCPAVFACGLGTRPGAVSGGAAVSRSKNGHLGIARAGFNWALAIFAYIEY